MKDESMQCVQDELQSRLVENKGTGLSRLDKVLLKGIYTNNRVELDTMTVKDLKRGNSPSPTMKRQVSRASSKKNAIAPSDIDVTESIADERINSSNSRQP
jgi:hypothetical protein